MERVARTTPVEVVEPAVNVLAPVDCVGFIEAPVTVVLQSRRGHAAANPSESKHVAVKVCCAPKETRADAGESVHEDAESSNI